MSFPARLYNDVFLNNIPIRHVATRGCLHPSTISIVDSCGIDKTIVVDCGRCVRCSDETREMWASRMYLHLCSDVHKDSPWKYAYFVTLTYGTYDLHQYHEHPFLDDWLLSFPVLDNDNYTGRFGYTPSVLCTRHIQNYFKRLRKSVTAKYKKPGVEPLISFVYSGEYGSTYSRPHWHTVIFSTVPLSQADVSEPWGYNIRMVSDTIAKPATGDTLEKHISFFSIGRVDFNDLYANGSLSDHVMIDGQVRDAKYSFTYVAKYCRKDYDFSDKLLKRFASIYYQLPLTGRRSVSAEDLHRGPFYNSLYDFAFCNRDLNFNGKLYENITFQDFCKIFAPKFSSSTSYGIAKEYFLSNVSRFASGDFTLPTFRDKPLVFPRYFSHLLALYRCPVCYEKACLSGISFAKGDLVSVRDYFVELRTNSYFVSDTLYNGDFGWQATHVAFNDDKWINRDYVVIHKPDVTARVVLDLIDNDPVWVWYVYDKHLRQYYRYLEMPFDEFCEYIIEILNKEIERSEKSVERLRQVKLVFDELVNSPEVMEEIQSYESLRMRNNSRYRASHYDIN